MKCRDCRFLSKLVKLGNDDFPAVRCELGIWDTNNKRNVKQYYTYGSVARNRGHVKVYGEVCFLGEPKN